MNVVIIRVMSIDIHKSVWLAVKILPTSMDSIEILNPVLFLTKIKPIANDTEETNPIAASGLVSLETM
jgi:hypothetical protein